jgi:hypothetical protein
MTDTGPVEAVHQDMGPDGVRRGALTRRRGATIRVRPDVTDMMVP